MMDISIHAPAWGATTLKDLHPDLREDFNPRARVGRDTARCSGCKALHDFNPRARVGRDKPKGGSHLLRLKISIHAPAWGATCKRLLVLRLVLISIHAPAWGATFLAMIRMSCH